MQPPFVHNGFLAEVTLVLSANRKEEIFQDRQPKGEEKELITNISLEENKHSFIQHDEAVRTYKRPGRVIEEVTRPNHLSHPANMRTESKTFACSDEVTEPDRAGLITSSQVLHSNDTCSIVFRGEERDLLLLRINSLQLR